MNKPGSYKKRVGTGGPDWDKPITDRRTGKAKAKPEDAKTGTSKSEAPTTGSPRIGKSKPSAPKKEVVKGGSRSGAKAGAPKGGAKGGARSKARRTPGGPGAIEQIHRQRRHLLQAGGG